MKVQTKIAKFRKNKAREVTFYEKQIGGSRKERAQKEGAVPAFEVANFTLGESP